MSSAPTRYGTQTIKRTYHDFDLKSEEVYTERRVLVANDQEELAQYIRFRKDTQNFPITTFRTEQKQGSTDYYVIMGWTERR